MPYSSKMVEATAPFPSPLIPENVKPEACRRLRCRMTMRQITTDAPIEDGVLFRHLHEDHIKDYVIPMAWLDDIDKDIWGEIKPWLASLHDEVA